MVHCVSKSRRGRFVVVFASMGATIAMAPVSSFARACFRGAQPLLRSSAPVRRPSASAPTQHSIASSVRLASNLHIVAAVTATAALAVSSTAPRVLRRRPSKLVRRCDGEDGQELEQEQTEAPSAAFQKLQEEVDELKAHGEEKRAAHERLKGEIGNFRARTRSELAMARGKAAIPVIKELLPIADEFDLAEQNLAVESEGEQAIVDRFDTLFTNMMQTWKAVGVEKMVSVGEDFNPEFHEAVSMIPSAEYKEEVVCNELRAGWTLKVSGADDAQVLRPALVCVSSGPGPA